MKLKWPTCSPPSLKVGQDYRYKERSPIYLLVIELASIDMLMCASMKLSHELKGGTSLCATPLLPPVAPWLEIEDQLPILL